jgi:DNA replicative helicase MCM subunit Mcm2 (Cdc46/Mcm family)
MPDLAQGLLSELVGMLISVHGVVLRCKSVKRQLTRLSQLDTDSTAKLLISFTGIA